MTRCLMALACCLMLAACAAPLRLENGKLSPPPGHGYVIAAITLNSLDQHYPDAGIELVGPAGGIRLEAHPYMDFIRAPGDEPDGNGKLHVAALPAGRYRVTELYGSWLDDWIGWRQLDRFPLDERFELAPGEVIYLGQYHISLDFRPSYTRTDMRRRDFNELKARRGVSDFSNIGTRLLPPTPQP